MEIENRVIEILKELSSKPDIDLTQILMEDLNLDSLLLVSLLIQIEDEFGLELEESDMNPFDLVTVEDVVNLVNKYTG